MPQKPAGFVPDGFEPDPAPAQPAGTAAPEGSPGQRFAEGAWKNLNPMGLVHTVAHPIDTIGALIDAHIEQLDKAKAAYKEGRYSEAAGHLAATALPVLGPAAANAGERIGSGDIAGGLGEAAGLLAATQAPKLIKAGGQAVARGISAATENAGPGIKAAAPYLARTALGYRGGQALDAAAAYKAAQEAASEPVAPPSPPPPVSESSLDLTKRLTTENAAKYGNVKPDLAAVLQPATESTPAPVIGKIAPKVYNEVAIMARRVGITLTDAEESAAVQMVTQGTSPAGAVSTVKNLRTATGASEALRASNPGFMSDAQVQSEIAARVGNRSPKR